jgi:hypothetical protein
MITVVAMIDVHIQPSKIQVWIVPGSTLDRGDGGEFEGTSLQTLLMRGGFVLGIVTIQKWRIG